METLQLHEQHCKFSLLGFEGTVLIEFAINIAGYSGKSLPSATVYNTVKKYCVFESQTHFGVFLWCMLE